MTNWIIAANPNKYDVVSAFEKYELIDWTQSAKYQVGDYIYIYVSKPYQKVMFKVEVIKTDIANNDSFNDTEFYLEPSFFNKNKEKKFVRLKKLIFEENDDLSLNSLLNKGLNRAPLGPIRVTESLQSYLNNYFQNSSYDPNEIKKEVADFIHEGAKKEIIINRYERNPIARQKCLDFHGVNCLVCNMNFEKVYGEVGCGFIHVHHLIPLHSIKEEYIVNPETDLIPVCPNCHAMLHQKIRGKYLSVLELKNLYTNFPGKKMN